MKTGKKIWHGLMILMAVLFTGNLHAQVTIGGEIPPETYSVLELIGQYNTSPDKYGGLRLPQLTTAQRNGLDVSSADPLAKGLLIYNTDNNCIEYWNNTKWISFCNDVLEPVDPCATPPSAGTISGNSYIKTWLGETTTKLSTDGTPGGSWSSSNPEVADVSSTGLVTRVGSSYGIVTITYTVGAGECISSAINTVYIACGAYTTSGEWLVFMCHNLGADESLDPFTYVEGNADGSGGTLGYLFQWGRPADGHEKRNSGTTTTQASTITPPHGDFIFSEYDWLSGGGANDRWGDGSDNLNMPKGANDPCPTGWKVPSIKQWQSIFSTDTANNQNHNAAEVNGWTWTGNGFKIGNALYLPATGYRYFNGNLFYVGTEGNYWSSTINWAAAHYLSFSDGSVLPSIYDYRSSGYSVRCVQEN